jgi:RNA polymerase primary sigma factor
MLASSRSKIHDHASPACPHAPRTSHSARNCETRGIRQAISRAMTNQARTVRIPVHMVEVINQLRSIRGRLIADLGREPTPQALVHTMMVTPEKVLEIQQYTRGPISLDQTISNEGGSPLGDFIEDPEAVDALHAAAFGLLQVQLQSVLATLNEREAGVIRLRFGLTDGRPRTLDAIGRVYGVTHERIRQIEAKSMTKAAPTSPLADTARLPRLAHQAWWVTPVRPPLDSR